MTSSFTSAAPSAIQAPRALRLAWLELQSQEPKLRVRDAAARLAVSEAELVATGIGSDTILLRPEWKGLLEALPALGRVLCLTRNEAVVHERHGRFEDVQVNGQMGLVLGPDIDLRLFLREWAFGFATEQTLSSGTRASLQFFDAAGQAVLKVYLTEDSDRSAYDRLVASFRAAEQTDVLTVRTVPAAEADRADAEIDLPGLRAAWEGMRDTHEFFGMLKRFRVGRLQALRLIGANLAAQVGNDALTRVLEAAAARGVEIMVFVGNRGNIQIHTGPVRKIAPMGPWINVLDADFNLHARTDHIASCWIVRKPTEDGVVTSLEIFDAAGGNLALLFGKRKPGIPEAADWRALVAELFPEARA